jgi:HPt (histidine-containing phosphotransfer) domain-containing protein
MVTPVLDPISLRKIRELQRAPGTDLLRKIASLYCEDTPRMLREMRAALDTGDASRLALSAHTLKSSSASLGATLCAELCHELEALGRASNLPAVGDKLDVLDVELQKVYHELDAVLVNAAA